MLGDPVYGTRKHRSYLKGHGIRFGGKPLGRSKKVTEVNREDLKRLKESLVKARTVAKVGRSE